MKKKLMCLFCVLLALALCVPAVPAQAEAQPQTTPEHELNEDDIREAMSMSGAYDMREYDGEKLHFYELRRASLPQNSPILIMLHDAGSRKEGMAGIVKPFVDAGYVVVVPDMPGYGESISDEPLDMFDIIQQAAKNIDIILSMYENMIYADSETFALLGSSLGAFTSLYYAAYSETKPQCVVSYYGSPDWSKVLNDGWYYTYRQNGESVPMTTNEEKKRLRTEITENAPDQNMEELLSVPLLLMNSDIDDRVPLKWIEDFQERAEAYPNQLTVSVREGAEHADLGDVDVTETAAFLQEHMPSVLAQAQTQP